MKPIIEAVPKELIERELTEERLLRATNNAGNFIYTIKAAEAPDIMREIGRLRELAFRQAGGGTGNEVDVDEQDLAPDGYTQLFVWDPVAREILGGYRYIICDSPYPKNLSTEHYFRFSDRFRQEVLPYTIELGRSFVQPRYQRTRDAKSLYALDNLWDGLGALIVENPDKQYFFGKVTMYGHYDKEARNILMYFLQKYFPDRDGLLEPLYPVEMNIDVPAMERIFAGGSYMNDYRTLVNELAQAGRVHSADDKFIHESVAFDEGFQHRTQSRFRRGGGDGHPRPDKGHLPGEGGEAYARPAAEAEEADKIGFGRRVSRAGTLRAFAEAAVWAAAAMYAAAALLRGAVWRKCRRSGVRSEVPAPVSGTGDGL